jgi:hypothetical protein
MSLEQKDGAFTVTVIASREWLLVVVQQHWIETNAQFEC